MFRRILVAFDGSEHAQSALAEATELAQANHAALTVMTVVPDDNLWLGAAVEVPVNLGGLDESVKREYTAMLERAVQSVPCELPVSKILKRGAVAMAILAELRHDPYDLVVMGSRGRGGLRSLLLGSVSHAVLHSSPVPVLVVRSRPTSNDAATHGRRAGTTTHLPA
jgi:nucleotide-binding universal stress UspA family protein